MRMTSRKIWIIAAAVVLLLLLPLPIAERYTSPTQDGQYILNPIKAYGFVLAAIMVSPDSELNTSGEALNYAKQEFTDAERPTKVELLFFPESETYSYTTESGRSFTLADPPRFVWEVWGVRDGGPAGSAEVIGFVSYETGEVLSSEEN